MSKNFNYILILLFLPILSCANSGSESQEVKNANGLNDAINEVADSLEADTIKTDSVRILKQKNYRSIHVFVALCDNVNQGIVPVPKSIGNGQDYNQNLYWGCGYGVRTYFKNSKNWLYQGKLKNPKSEVLERILFKHKDSAIYLLADAYDGAYIKSCNIDMLKALSGDFESKVIHENDTLQFGGSSELVSYIGHNGLMDFSLPRIFNAKDSVVRQSIILACKSSDYYGEYIKDAGAYPLVVTNGFMAPEAYSLEWAIRGWVLNETPKQVEERASQAYNHYQKCGLKGARWLMKSGW